MDRAYFDIVVIPPRIRAAVTSTVIVWIVVAGAVSLPLVTAPMPTDASVCPTYFTDPGWAWMFRDVVWILLAVFLPVAAAFAGVLAWLSGASVRTCTAIGVGIGCVLMLGTLGQAMASAYCYVEVHLY